jgi:Fucose permease
MLVEKRFFPLYIVLFCVYTLFGISMTVIGATLPKIFADFGWSYTTAGAVIALGSVGYFLSSYVAGILLSALGLRLTISFALLFIFIGLEFFAATPTPWLNMLLYFIVGVGQGGIELAVDWGTLRMEGPGGGRAMSLMHGAFSIGAFVGPLIIAILISARLQWTLVYRGIGVLFFLIAIFCSSCRFRRLDGTEVMLPAAPGAICSSILHTGWDFLRCLCMWASSWAFRTGSRNIL